MCTSRWPISARAYLADGSFAYTATAAELGFDMVSANDHLVWRRPWLDGLTCLASVVGSAGNMRLATSVALPAVRHPVVLAKAIASLGVLAGGPVIAGLGPGSSAADYKAVGLPFTERWARFDECLRLVRALVRGEALRTGYYYRVGGLQLDPLPSVPPQVWFGSWGSDLQLRRMAGAADGWLASAYNTTPEHFAECPVTAGRTTCWPREGTPPPILTRSPQPGCMSPTSTLKPYRLVSEILAPLLGRDPSELLANLPIGTPEHCVELLDAYAEAGANRMLLWPIQDPIHQLQVFSEEVRPHLHQTSR